jgi:hypothetical protein
MACALCETRRPRRFCPGVRGDICTICCGTEREVSVDCPLDCEYLREAHQHERPAPLDPATVPNHDIRVTDEFLQANDALLAFAGGMLMGAAFDTPGTVDSDVREALDALVRTFRTLQSGVYYETRPNNPLAANIAGSVRQAIERFRQREREESGVSHTRDADVLGVLVFLQRLEYDRSNGRRRGRAFLDFLHHTFPVPPGLPAPQASSLIVP